MIKSKQPITLVEVKELLKEKEEKEELKNVFAYAKKYSKISIEKARELKEKLAQLGLIKMKPEHITKIIDIMPQDADDLRKIFFDITLDENEINSILQLLKS